MENIKENLMKVHTDDEQEYYSINALDELGEFEHYILPKTFEDEEAEDADFFRLCTLFDFNFNKVLTIRNFNKDSMDVSTAKDVEPKNFSEVDSNVCTIITNVRKMPLIIRSSSILNVLVCDPVKKVVALSAVSINQTLGKSLKNLVLELNVKYNVNPMDLKVAIVSFGDSYMPVDNETLEVLKNNFVNISHYMSQAESDIIGIDVSKINIATLLEVGVKYENILNIKKSDLPNSIQSAEKIYTIINIK